MIADGPALEGISKQVAAAPIVHWQDEAPARRPPIVCLCGSTRFRDEFTAVNRDLTLAGHIVVAPGVFAHSGDPRSADDKEHLDGLHLRKIELADWVLVVKSGGYIGESTRREIEYAHSIGKPVTCLEDGPEPAVYVTPGHPVRAGAGYDCNCGECLYRRRVASQVPDSGLADWPEGGEG